MKAFGIFVFGEFMRIRSLAKYFPEELIVSPETQEETRLP
jgi:hypothetical protein